jgi:hypothetical protein
MIIRVRIRLTCIRRVLLFYSLAAMTIRAFKFTPEVLLEAPRRGEGIPNSDASKVLYTLGAYSFSEHKKTSELRLLDVASQQTSLVTKDNATNEVAWLDDKTIVLLKSNENGTTTVVVGFPDSFEKRYATSPFVLHEKVRLMLLSALGDNVSPQ